MAKITLTLADGQTWIYPAKSYTGLDNIRKNKNTWYKGHSVLSRRGKYCYQGGTSDRDGNHNGNMLSIFLFKDSSGRTLKNAIKAIGGSGKITKISFKMYVSSGWGGYFTPRICMTPYWDTSSLTGRTSDSYDGLGFKYLFTTSSLKKSSWYTVDLTNYKGHFDAYESLAFYCPGAYNASNSSYGAIHAQLEANPPQLIIEYNENSAPNPPTVTLNSGKDSNGYSAPYITFTVKHNGDPENNLHSSPYKYEIFNQNGTKITASSWGSTDKFNYDLSQYRGQTVTIRGIVRDTEGLTASSDMKVYVNSLPYWGSSRLTIAGAPNGIFNKDITVSWDKARDSQSQHENNLRYSIFAYIGTDVGDVKVVARNIAETRYTFNATSIDGTAVSKGEKIKIVVRVNDGLEDSTGFLQSDWIFREHPPTAPSNVQPTSGFFEDSVKVTWSPAQGVNGAIIMHYVLNLLDENDKIVESHLADDCEWDSCYHISEIPRGKAFRFEVYAVDNNSNRSRSAYSGWLYRNTGVSRPLNFRVDSTASTFKHKIPLKWSPSISSQTKKIFYNIYFRNLKRNETSFRPLVKGLINTFYNHILYDESAGSRFEYYIEAYDEFGVLSEKTFLNSFPEINTPPEAPDIILPINNKILYSNVPRLVFRFNKVCNDNPLTVSITVNGITYTSEDNSELFNKETYNKEDIGIFEVPSHAPLNYSKQNTVSIKVFDTLDESEANTYNFIVNSPTFNKVGETEARLVSAKELNNLKAMIDNTRIAYGLQNISWHEGVESNKSIYKKFFEQASNAIYEVNDLLNNKVTGNELDREYIKDVFALDTIIKKSMINNLTDMILKP